MVAVGELTMSAKKARPRPVREASAELIRELVHTAKLQSWSPLRVRRELRRLRVPVSPETWRLACCDVIGVGVLGLPDWRQLVLFGAD